jgi:hypothetical protein
MRRLVSHDFGAHAFSRDTNAHELHQLCFGTLLATTRQIRNTTVTSFLPMCILALLIFQAEIMGS